jgi:hypothetical protein
LADTVRAPTAGSTENLLPPKLATRGGSYFLTFIRRFAATALDRGATRFQARGGTVGDVVEVKKAGIKVKWDSGQTSYFRHGKKQVAVILIHGQRIDSLSMVESVR